MQFPASFFEDEVRNGFYVPALMKRAWAAQLEVLQDIAQVCEKYHIQWFADVGTLLGAVRHGGFIPWDDDLDISMFRDDYTLFNAVVERELPNYYITIPPNIGNKHCIYTCLSNSSSIRWDKTHMEKYHGFPLITGIDIFPLDYLAPDPDDEELRESLATIVRSAAQAINEQNQDSQEMRNRVSQIEELLQVQLDRNKDMKEQLFSLLEGILAMYNNDSGAKEAAIMHYWIWYRTHKVPIHCYREQILLPFETTQIPAPAGYDEILSIKYGDYMKFSYTGGGHNYPYYDFMIKRLADTFGEEHLLYKYRFAESDLKRQTNADSQLPGNRAGEKKPREIVFLAWKASMWDQLRPAWELARRQPDCSVYVIPTPYCYRNSDGSLGEMKWDGPFPADVPITDYTEYDFKKRRPSMIVFQNPYDECNPSTSAHPSFYARNLKPYTDQLIYIPWFVTNEIGPGDQKSLYNMRYYAAMPGVALADWVILQSEQMRHVYIHFLTAFAGENTKKIWEEKIICNFQIPFLKMK